METVGFLAQKSAQGLLVVVVFLWWLIKALRMPCVLMAKCLVTMPNVFERLLVVCLKPLVQLVLTTVWHGVIFWWIARRLACVSNVGKTHQKWAAWFCLHWRLGLVICWAWMICAITLLLAIWDVNFRWCWKLSRIWWVVLSMTNSKHGCLKSNMTLRFSWNLWGKLRQRGLLIRLMELGRASLWGAQTR